MFLLNIDIDMLFLDISPYFKFFYQRFLWKEYYLPNIPNR